MWSGICQVKCEVVLQILTCRSKLPNSWDVKTVKTSQKNDRKKQWHHKNRRQGPITIQPKWPDYSYLDIFHSFNLPNYIGHFTRYQRKFLCMHIKEISHLDLRDFTGYFENERQVKYKLEDDPSCGITTGALFIHI